MTAFPLRMVYRTTLRQESAPQVRLLISVSKRYFKHAVDRNRVKRQLREAYRLNKHLLYEALADQPQQGVDIALIWLESRLHDSEHVSKRVRSLLLRLKEEGVLSPQSYESVASRRAQGVQGVQDK